MRAGDGAAATVADIRSIGAGVNQIAAADRAPEGEEAGEVDRTSRHVIAALNKDGRRAGDGGRNVRGDVDALLATYRVRAIIHHRVRAEKEPTARAAVQRSIHAKVSQIGVAIIGGQTASEEEACQSTRARRHRRNGRNGDGGRAGDGRRERVANRNANANGHAVGTTICRRPANADEGRAGSSNAGDGSEGRIGVAVVSCRGDNWRGGLIVCKTLKVGLEARSKRNQRRRRVTYRVRLTAEGHVAARVSRLVAVNDANLATVGDVGGVNKHHRHHSGVIHRRDATRIRTGHLADALVILIRCADDDGRDVVGSVGDDKGDKV